MGKLCFESYELLKLKLLLIESQRLKLFKALWESNLQKALHFLPIGCDN